MSCYLITTNTEVPDRSIKAIIVCQDGFIETRKSIQTLLYPWLQHNGPDMCSGSCNILMTKTIVMYCQGIECTVTILRSSWK